MSSYSGIDIILPPHGKTVGESRAAMNSAGLDLEDFERFIKSASQTMERVKSGEFGQKAFYGRKLIYTDLLAFARSNFEIPDLEHFSDYGLSYYECSIESKS